MTKTHPMLYSAPMVQALLREIKNPGTGKTQTRRLLKPQLGDIATAFEVMPGKWRFLDRQGVRVHQVLKLPHQPGDLIWVREAHSIHSDWNRHDGFVTYVADKCCWHTGPNTGDIPDANLAAWFKAIDKSAKAGHKKQNRPSIHMPKWASRITLQVTDVRVQQLQEISEADAISEGILKVGSGCYGGDPYPLWKDYLDVMKDGIQNPCLSFETLWDSLNTDRAPWDSNPWIVAYTFKPHLRNVNDMERGLL